MTKTGCVLLCGLLAVMMVRAADPEPEPAGPELAALKGTWTTVKMTFRDRDLSFPKDNDFIFEGGRLTRMVPPRKDSGKGPTKLTYKVKLDTRKKPYRLTAVPDAGGGVVASWIYKIEKGELTLATARMGGFPADFTGDVATIVLRKKK